MDVSILCFMFYKYHKIAKTHLFIITKELQAVGSCNFVINEDDFIVFEAKHINIHE